jgi:hypothetical protein
LAAALGCTVTDLTETPPQHVGNTPDLPPVIASDGDDHDAIAALTIKPGMGGGAIEDASADAVRVMFPRRLIRDQLQARHDELRLVEVEGASMAPLLESGDQVLVNVAKRNPTPPGIFCLWDGYGIVCKLVERIPRTDPPSVRIRL